MRRTLLIALLLTLSTLPALADQADSPIFSQVRLPIKIAQLGADERRELRDRWEQASPEERIRMRQFFQDRLRQLPPPAQEAIRLPFPGAATRDNGRGNESNRNKDLNPPADSRFGFGFEKRRFEEIRPELPAWPGGRRQRDDERRD